MSFSYSGLNHLGWISSFRVEGEERIGELIGRYEELQRFDHRFAAFDADVVRRVGAVPTEYVFYYYDPHRYVEGVARAGSSRGQDVMRLNEELLSGIARSFEQGGLEDAWSTYSLLLGVRHDTYMRTDTEGDSHQAQARTDRDAAGPARLQETDMGGYEGVALQVIAGLTLASTGAGDSQHPERIGHGVPGAGRRRRSAHVHPRWRPAATGLRRAASFRSRPGDPDEGVRAHPGRSRGNL